MHSQKNIPKYEKEGAMMKKILLILFCFQLTIRLFSNDYYFYYVVGGNVIPAENNSTNVEMKEEIITIELFDDYYKVTVDFFFYNNGENENLLVGFPYSSSSNNNGGSGSIYNFSTWINDAPVEHSNKPIDMKWSNYKESNVDYVFTKNVLFLSHETTKTKVEYNAKYGRNGHEIAAYLYGSGRGWYKDIGKIKIIINNNTDKWIYGITAGKIEIRNYFQWKDENIEIILNNIEPEINDIIEIKFNYPMFDFGPKIFPYSFPYRTSVIDKEVLSFFSKSQLRILRNLYYAFYGYNFQDVSLKNYYLNYFQREPWYKTNVSFSENMITETERTNINIILEEERK
jgi:hypothetical protein